MNPMSQKRGKLNPYLLLCPPRLPKLPSAPPSLQLCDIKAAPASPHRCLPLGFRQILPMRRFQLQQRRGIREIIILPVKEGKQLHACSSPKLFAIKHSAGTAGFGMLRWRCLGRRGGHFQHIYSPNFSESVYCLSLVPKAMVCSFPGFSECEM